MFKKIFLKTFYKPNLCNTINIKKYPWGWKSNNEISKIIEYPVSGEDIYIENDRKFIHEYKLNEYAEDIYLKTYYAYLQRYDFLNSPIFTPKLANALNNLRAQSNLINLNENICVKKINIIGSWIKYGRISNNQKILGLYNNFEFVHEITTGIIGPEIQNIWDQKAIKQKTKILIESNLRKDVFEFERDLMIYNDNWQLCNINRIII